MNTQGGIKNESKKNFIDLLGNLNLPSFKYREIGGKIDLFFPSCDVYIYLDKIESIIFRYIFVDKKDLQGLIRELKEKSLFNKEGAEKKIKHFTVEILKELK